MFATSDSLLLLSFEGRWGMPIQKASIQHIGESITAQVRMHGPRRPSREGAVKSISTPVGKRGPRDSSSRSPIQRAGERGKEKNNKGGSYQHYGMVSIDAVDWVGSVLTVTTVAL